MMKGGYGYKIHVDFLIEAEEKARSMGTVVYLDEIPDTAHIIVSCDLPPRTPERREFDNFLRLLYVREKADTLVQ